MPSSLLPVSQNKKTNNSVLSYLMSSRLSVCLSSCPETNIALFEGILVTPAVTKVRWVL